MPSQPSWKSDEKLPHCVIGSGPAGVSCATALLKQGRPVLMLDAGLQLEPERAQLVERIRQSPREEWEPQILEKLQEGMEPGPSGIPLKRLFGSDFPYRDAEDHLHVDRRGIGLRPSLAFGGLSMVWGSSMLPYLDRDIPDWPISVADLVPHYRSALELTGLSAAQDALAEFFPLFAPSFGSLEPSRQANALLRKLDRHQGRLRQAGIYHGRSRLAIKAARGQEAGCNYCGFCMYGCPYGYIYKSDDTVAQLKRSENFTYQADFIVSTVRETADRVIISGHHRVTREPITREARRVFLAAGVVPTTGILLRSLSAYDRPVRLKDSQYFLLPLVASRVANIRNERLHTLSQVFLEIFDSAISPYTVHLQVYSFNDLIAKAMRKSLGPLARPLELCARELEARLLLIQGYLHSAHSGEITAVLRKDSATGKETLSLAAAVNPSTRSTVRRITGKLLRHFTGLGIIPLPMLLKVGEPGQSYHVGGSFPMRRNPADMETDILGRPAGWKRVHAADATTFPGIPATTITLTTMANAHRIGSEAAHLE